MSSHFQDKIAILCDLSACVRGLALISRVGSVSDTEMEQSSSLFEFVFLYE